MSDCAVRTISVELGMTAVPKPQKNGQYSTGTVRSVLSPGDGRCLLVSDTRTRRYLRAHEQMQYRNGTYSGGEVVVCGSRSSLKRAAQARQR